MPVARISILEKAMKLYQQYGIRNTTMNDIAIKLGISKKTLYQHIPNKEKLLESVINKDLQLKHQLLVGCSIDKEEKIAGKMINLVRLIFQFVAEKSMPIVYDLRRYYPDLYINYIKRFTTLVSGQVIKNIKEGARNGEYRKKINEERFSRILLSSILNMNENDLIPINESGSNDFQVDFTRHVILGLINNQEESKVEELISKIYKKTT